MEGDESGVDISKAKTEEEVIETINSNIRYIQSTFDDFEDFINGRINILTKVKDEALKKKEQLQILVDDLQAEVNKKTNLVGKLQVKIYMLISILEHKEMMSK